MHAAPYLPPFTCLPACLPVAQITSDGLRHLATLHSLESLVLVDCPRAVTVLGMRPLCGAAGLHTLDVSDNKRLDDGCMQVGGGNAAAPHVTCHSPMAGVPAGPMRMVCVPVGIL